MRKLNIILIFKEGRETLQVTEKDKQAIHRLKQMGFPESKAIQAYYTSAKNEECAAKFLRWMS